MKKLMCALCLSTAALLPIHASAMTHTVGTDVVRLIDNNMDDGMFNIFWQGSLNRKAAVRASYSSGNDLSILEVTYKGYIDRYHQGVFYEVGGAWWDGRNDDELGLMAAIGYERSLAKHVVAGGSVQMVAGIDDAIGMGESPFFLPSLFIAFAF